MRDDVSFDKKPAVRCKQNTSVFKCAVKLAARLYMFKHARAQCAVPTFRTVRIKYVLRILLYIIYISYPAWHSCVGD